MAICAGISALGSIMTFLFVRETGDKELEDVDACSRVRRCPSAGLLVHSGTALCVHVAPEEYYLAPLPFSAGAGRCARQRRAAAPHWGTRV